MSKLRGEDVIIGLGAENPGARGTKVTPQIWLPARKPAQVDPIVEKTLIKETRGTKIASTGSEIQQKRVEGDIEFNVRSESIGFILKSLLGKVESALKAGETVVYEHTFTVLAEDPQHPTLTLGLSQPNVQDFNMPNCVVSSLELNVAVDDLVNAKASFIGKTEATETSYSPSEATDDDYFRQYDVTVKIADDVAGLAAANAMELKEFNLTIANNARPDFNIGSLTPSDILALVIEPTGSFMSDVENTDLHDVYVAGTYKAMQVTLNRADVEIGSASTPKLVITMPKVSFEKWAPDRPIDDIVTENIDYQAHYDSAEAYAVKVVVTNKREDYLAADES